MIFLVCGFLLTGCASTVIKSNTIKTASVDLEIEAVKLVADLKVSDKRVSGQASGKIGKELSKEDITSQALTKAMGQDPPSAEGPDVLVGINRFEEWKGKKRLTVTVSGYPAWYTNFHNAVDSDSALLLVGGAWGGLGGKYQEQWKGLSDKALKVPKAQGERKFDHYFTVKYAMPWGGLPPAAPGTINLEGGWIWGNGTFFGIDLNAGVGEDATYKNGEKWGMILGGGFNFGGVYDLPVENLQLVFGGAVGFWWVDDEYNYERYIDDGRYGYYSSGGEYKTDYNFLAPFIRLRWNYIELSYRGLLGIRDHYYASSDYGDDDGGFGWNNHQVMIGVYFATSKRGSK